MPKQEILEAIEMMEEEQERIALIDAQAKMMSQRANQFLGGDVSQQAAQISDAQQMINAQ